MKNTFFVFFILYILGIIGSVYPLDWKRLHNESNGISLEQAIINSKNDTDIIENLYVLGLVYLNKHKNHAAEETFKRIISLDSSAYEAKWGLAEVLRRNKFLQESESILNELIKKEPNFIPPYITLAYLKYTQTQFNIAVSLASQVIKKGQEASDLSNFTRAHLIYAGAKGMIASRGGPISKLINGTQVLPHLKKAESFQPNSPEVLFGLGNFYFLAPHIAGGDLQKALDYLIKAIEADPLLVDAYIRLAQVY
ncbi:MAG: tetratricopeptide repeat protein, partial [Candidatus Omnitrophica bacterium]|nr:tetratricopeptide repeat protein [Candidatus Omnitrophota bacterium]